jgi:hypothetical protein
VEMTIASECIGPARRGDRGGPAARPCRPEDNVPDAREVYSE